MKTWYKDNDFGWYQDLTNHDKVIKKLKSILFYLLAIFFVCCFIHSVYVSGKMKNIAEEFHSIPAICQMQKVKSEKGEEISSFLSCNGAFDKIVGKRNMLMQEETCISLFDWKVVLGVDGVYYKEAPIAPVCLPW